MTVTGGDVRSMPSEDRVNGTHMWIKHFRNFLSLPQRQRDVVTCLMKEGRPASISDTLPGDDATQKSYRQLRILHGQPYPPKTLGAPTGPN